MKPYKPLTDDTSSQDSFTTASTRPDYTQFYKRAVQLIADTDDVLASGETASIPHPMSDAIMHLEWKLDFITTNWNRLRRAKDAPPLERHHEDLKFQMLKETFLCEAADFLEDVTTKEGWIDSRTFGEDANRAALTILINAHMRPDFRIAGYQMAARFPEGFNDPDLFRELEDIAIRIPEDDPSPSSYSDGAASPSPILH